MIGDLFDSPWKVLIVAVLLIVLFGSKKLPEAARSLGRSMRILKSEVSNLGEDEHETHAASASSPVPVPQLTAAATAAPAAASAPATAPAEHQNQIDALQQQIRDLQRAAAMDPAPVATAPEPQHTQPS